MTAAVRKSMTNIGAFFSILGAAISASAAVRAHQAPSPMDLRVLGIEPTRQVLEAFKGL